MSTKPSSKETETPEAPKTLGETLKEHFESKPAKEPAWTVEIDLVDKQRVILPAADEADARAQADAIKTGPGIMLPVTDSAGAYWIIATWQIVTIRVEAD